MLMSNKEKEPVLIRWEAFGNGVIKVYPEDVKGMNLEDMVEWIAEDVKWHIYQNDKCTVKVEGVKDLFVRMESGEFDEG
jgi:hypothetical protein